MTREIMLGHQIAGLRSQLYPYQRESVSTMLFREMSESDVPDPLYIPVTGLNKSVFYLQPATMEILRERPMVTAQHGGVLCEELGMYFSSFAVGRTMNRTPWQELERLSWYWPWY